jgi:hypothetical protein
MRRRTGSLPSSTLTDVSLFAPVPVRVSSVAWLSCSLSSQPPLVPHKTYAEALFGTASVVILTRTAVPTGATAPRLNEVAYWEFMYQC